MTVFIIFYYFFYLKQTIIIVIFDISQVCLELSILSEIVYQILLVLQRTWLPYLKWNTLSPVYMYKLEQQLSCCTACNVCMFVLFWVEYSHRNVSNCPLLQRQSLLVI